MTAVWLPIHAMHHRKAMVHAAQASRPSSSLTVSAFCRLAVISALLVTLGRTALAAAPDAAEQQIIDAVVLAYSLEAGYWRDPNAYPTWDSLYGYYRRGFSADIAERMTEFSLSNEGDMATWIPSQVHVVDHGPRFALAWFRTPQDFGKDSPWGFEPYMVVRLRREDGRWVVYWAADGAEPPTR
jgi:hypothetical protein